MATRPPYAFDCADEGYIIVFTVSGTGMLNYDNIDYCLEAYSIAFVPCEKCYRLYAAENDYHWRFLFLIFDGKQAEEYYKYISKEPVGTLESRDTIMSLLWRIINRYNTNKPESFTELKTFSNIIDILAEIALINTTDSYYDLPMPDYLKSIFYYIDSHYMGKITLDLLEEEYSISKYHIARQFKKYSGITVNEYVISKRLNRAKFLLRHTNSSVGEIAEKVGFYDARHFIYQFKKREHMTPNAYRKTAQV